MREAQQVRDLDTLAAHLDELPESTCLILCYKKKADKRKALYKAISERGGVFESTKMYDSKIPDLHHQELRRTPARYRPTHGPSDGRQHGE